MYLYVYFIVFRLFKDIRLRWMDMLDEYKRKRNFKATPEPNGNNNPNDENSIITGDAIIPNNNQPIKIKTPICDPKT